MKYYPEKPPEEHTNENYVQLKTKKFQKTVQNPQQNEKEPGIQEIEYKVIKWRVEKQKGNRMR